MNGRSILREEERGSDGTRNESGLKSVGCVLYIFVLRWQHYYTPKTESPIGSTLQFVECSSKASCSGPTTSSVMAPSVCRG